MKTLGHNRFILSITFMVCVGAVAADRPKEGASNKELTRSKEVTTFSSFDPTESRDTADLLAPGTLKFESGDLMQVLAVYQELSHRTVIYSSTLPTAKITIQNQTPLSRREALQLLDTALAQSGVTMVLLGTKFVKAVPSAQASTEAGPVIELPPNQLPESSSYMTYIIELKSASPREVAPALAPLSKMPNGILAIDSAGVIIIRDYSSNIRRMLQVVDKIEKGPGAPPPAK